MARDDQSSEETDSASDGEITVLNIVPSPDPKRVSTAIGNNQPRQSLAMKKAAQKREEEKINQILFEAGFDPEEVGDFETRKQIADTLAASANEDEERRKREKEFEVEAGLRRRSEETESGKEDDEIEKGEKADEVEAAVDTLAGYLSEDENDEEKEMLEKRRKAEERRKAFGIERDAEKIAGVEIEIQDTGRGKKLEKRKNVESAEDSSADEKRAVTSKRARTIASDTEDSSDAGDQPTTSRVTDNKSEQAQIPAPKSFHSGFDDIMAQYASGYVKTNPESPERKTYGTRERRFSQPTKYNKDNKEYKFYKSKNGRATTTSDGRGDEKDDDNDEVKIDDDSDDNESSKPSTSSGLRRTPRRSIGFLADAQAKAESAENDGSTNASVSNMLSNAGTFVKDVFTGFAGMVASPSSQEKQQSQSQEKKLSQLEFIKKIQSDEEMRAKYEKFSAKFDALAERVEEQILEEVKCSFTIQSMENVTYIPGTLIIDPKAPCKSVISRSGQGGVQPFRSCRLKQGLLTINQAAAKVTEDHDSEDDFLPAVPSLKRRIAASKKPEPQVIAVEDDNEPEVPDQPCPVCDKKFSVKRIEDHVNKCLERNEDGSGSGNDSERAPRSRRDPVSRVVDFLQM